MILIIGSRLLVSIRLEKESAHSTQRPMQERKGTSCQHGPQPSFGCTTSLECRQIANAATDPGVQ